MLLLLCVFALVNASVLVLRRDPVDQDHYRAPTWMPVLGAIVCLILILPITGRSAAVYTRAAVLLALGVALWFVNRLFVQKSLRAAARPCRSRNDAATLQQMIRPFVTGVSEMRKPKRKTCLLTTKSTDEEIVR